MSLVTALPRDISRLSDRNLVEFLKKGDRRAGDAIYQRHSHFVATIVYDVLKDLSAVEDVMQEVFLKAFYKIHLYNPQHGPFIAWLLTLSRNEAITYLRRGKRFNYFSLDHLAPHSGLAPSEHPSHSVYMKELWGFLAREIHALPEPDRTILRGRLLAWKQFEQVSHPLGMPLNSVKTIYYRRIEQIRSKMATLACP